MLDEMKYVILLLFHLSCSCVFSQNSDDFLLRAKAGTLTHEECSSLIDAGNYDDAIPSLIKIKQYQEMPQNYNGQSYYGTVIELYVCYLKNVDISLARDLIDDAIDVCGRRESSKNNVYTRLLLCCRGQIESIINKH